LGIRSLGVKQRTVSGDFHADVVTDQGQLLIKQLSQAIATTGLSVEIYNNAALPFVITVPANKNALTETRRFLEAMEPPG
ncbi:MAG TPA: hypothetical protein DHU63_06120, partial [Candidatus Marinimicrobia bacterium]|nr:hypothetical protein [Candidatus Neomarinimicrobiota bacterium]